MPSAPLPAVLRPRPVAIAPERLESCLRRLDPADRALLDLSLNRGLPDWSMAPILRTDPMRLAWKRARAIQCVASRLGLTDPADLPAVRDAMTRLPDRAWLPLELQPAPAPPLLAPPEPAGTEPRVTASGAALPHPAQALAVRDPAPGSTYGRAAAPDASTFRTFGRAAASSLGGLSERAKRAYPRGTMRTRARRAAGTFALGAAAALAITRKRR